MKGAALRKEPHKGRLFQFELSLPKKKKKNYDNKKNWTGKKKSIYVDVYSLVTHNPFP